MRLPIVVRLALIVLPALLAFAVLPVLAQNGAPGPRRLTTDGQSSPFAWDADGIRFTRPGALVAAVGVSRIASELYRLDTASGAAVLLSPDAPPPPPRGPAIAGATRIYVVNPNSLEPELWIANADGSDARLLLRGDSEYFFDPVISPDGRQFVFVRTPTGSETHVTSAVWAGQTDGRNVRRLLAEASAPVWSPDSTQLAFEHRGDVFVASAALPVASWPEPLRTSGAGAAPSAPASTEALTPPSTIAVLHTSTNAGYPNCTPATVTVGTIRVLPFETYVSWVVPTEVSASSPAERLKTQAVAARTYAWYKVLTRPVGQAYDVTDDTTNQAMCQLRADSRSDAATQATNGQYVAYNGAVIVALYSAENGDPTKTNYYQFYYGSYPYLTAVDDPVSFGYLRNGHGQGMSQNGAYRWALTYGWNYIQILTHYYSGVKIEGGTTLGSLVAPWNGRWIISNRARIAGTANNSGAFNVSAVGGGLTATRLATNTLLTTLDLSVLPDQPLGSLVITGTLTNTLNVTSTVLLLGVDRQPPTGTVSLPVTTTVPTVALMMSGTDAGPSGYAGYSVSYGWVWEGEDKVAQGYVYPTPASGTVVSDAGALNGQAIYAPAGTGGVWYGPYTWQLPLGQPYRVFFRMKVDNNQTTSEIAKIDVVADGNAPGGVIGLRHLYGTDFQAANVYQEFPIDIEYDMAYISPTTGVEFRVDFPGTTDLWLDRILVATYPSTSTAPVTWVLTPTLGVTQTVIVKFSDLAGNVSADVAASTVYTLPNRVYLPAIVAP